MRLNMTSADISYFYGESLISLKRFAELFIISLAYNDGVLDFNGDKVQGKLPLDYEEKIEEYIEHVGDKKNIAQIVDLGFYSMNSNIWFEELGLLIDDYINENSDSINVDVVKDDYFLLTMPLDKVFSVMDKYDKEVAKNMIDLTTYINSKEETELERLGRMINQVGLEKPKTKIITK